MTAAPPTIAEVRERIARPARAQLAHLPRPLQRILGTAGVLWLDHRHQPLQVVSDRPGDRGVVLEAFGVDTNAEIAQHFLGCIRPGEAQPPYASGEDGRRAPENALAGYQWVRSGQPVTLPWES